MFQYVKVKKLKIIKSNIPGIHVRKVTSPKPQGALPDGSCLPFPEAPLGRFISFRDENLQEDIRVMEPQR